MKVFRPSNYVPTGGQLNVLPSLTVPDQALSIKDIYDRHRKGLPIEGNVNPIFEESNGINPAAMDLVDIQEYKNELERMKKEYEQFREQQKQSYKQRLEQEATKEAEEKTVPEGQ